jgi:hypothetical protein
MLSSRGPTKRIETTVLPDGTLEVRTPDEGQPHFAEARAREVAEVQAAIDTLRATGVSRPVHFCLADPGWAAAKDWRLLLPGLRSRGIATFSTGADGFSYVVRPDVAQELLRPLYGKGAARLFRTASWPVSYHTIEVTSDAILVMESRTYKDMARSEGAA